MRDLDSKLQVTVTFCSFAILFNIELLIFVSCYSSQNRSILTKKKRRTVTCQCPWCQFKLLLLISNLSLWKMRRSLASESSLVAWQRTVCKWRNTWCNFGTALNSVPMASSANGTWHELELVQVRVSWELGDMQRLEAWKFVCWYEYPLTMSFSRYALVAGAKRFVSMV